MVQENHIDKALAFMESLEKLGNQLKAAEEHQKQLIARMLDLKKENLTDGEEYAELSQKSKVSRTSSTNGALSIWSAWRW